MSKPDTPAWCKAAAAEICRENYVMGDDEINASDIAALIARRDPSAALRAAAEEAFEYMQCFCNNIPGCGCQACEIRRALKVALAATAAPACARCERLIEAIALNSLAKTMGVDAAALADAEAGGEPETH